MTAPAKSPTARDVARAYSGDASWVPCVRQMPPAGELIEVLYEDGVVGRARVVTFDGGALFDPLDNVVRYVRPAFWRPL